MVKKEDELEVIVVEAPDYVKLFEQEKTIEINPLLPS